MADYLVLEEDGTSRLELEESADDLLLEDGSLVYATRGSGFVGLTSAGGLPPPSPSYATWEVGVITVPSSTGTTSVTGLGGKPAAVFFFGTNWLTEDAAVTTTGTAIFRGMCAPKWDDAGTLLQNGASVSPAGDQWTMHNFAIICHSTAGTGVDLYRASVSSLDSDGFTLSWEAAAAGGYQVVYVALMDVAECGSYGGPSATLSLGWRAGACLLHGGWTGTTTPIGANADRTAVFYGGAGYPQGSTWYGAGLTAYTFPGSIGAQYNIGIFNQPPNIVITQDGNSSGPFLATQNVTATPSGSSQTDFAFGTNLDDNPGFFVAWDDADSQTGDLTPASTTGGTQTVSGLPFAPGLVIGYSISNEPQGQSTGGRGAVGFSVIADGFQWSALIDGVGRGSFQSFQRGVVDAVENTDVHAASAVLTSDGFVLTTEEDDTPPSNWVWHAFGHPERLVAWIPKIARWMVGP